MEKPKFPADQLEKQANAQLGAGCIVIVALAIVCVGLGVLIGKYWL